MIEYAAALLDGLVEAIDTFNLVGLLAIAGLALLADVGLPVPLVIEPSLFYVIYHKGPLSLAAILFVVMLAVGRQAGTATLYWISRLTGSRVGGWAGKRFPNFSRRFARQVDRLQSHVCNQQECGRRLLIIATSVRLTPGLLPFQSIVAGTLRWPYHIMVIATVISGLAYDIVLVFLGSMARLGLRVLSPQDSFLVAVILAGLVGFIPIVIGLIAGRKRKQG